MAATATSPLRVEPSPGRPLAPREAAIEIHDLRHRYGGRRALDGITLDVARGEIFALLGPNGGGKSTLFRILSTALRPTSGHVRVLGQSLAGETAGVRRRMGVVFQHPGLDGKLTVRENLLHHGHLYGFRGGVLRQRIGELAERLAIADRLGDRVETLSGGLARRADLARGLLHGPELLLLDEPTTGLDPGARRDFSNALWTLREREHVTVLLTTHYMEEAERADRVGVLHQGTIVALGSPDELKRGVGGDVIVIHGEDAERLRRRIAERLGVDGVVVDGVVRIERDRGHEFVRDVVEALPGEVRSVTFGRPTLEDVFVHLTGQRFWGDAEARP
jgi:ABC-2 type transport system ATP-binding protein